MELPQFLGRGERLQGIHPQAGTGLLSKGMDMARIGSSDGLGKKAAQLLVADGHAVVVRAQNQARAAPAVAQVPVPRLCLAQACRASPKRKVLAGCREPLRTVTAMVCPVIARSTPCKGLPKPSALR